MCPRWGARTRQFAFRSTPTTQIPDDLPAMSSRQMGLCRQSPREPATLLSGLPPPLRRQRHADRQDMSRAHGVGRWLPCKMFLMWLRFRHSLYTPGSLQSSKCKQKSRWRACARPPAGFVPSPNVLRYSLRIPSTPNPA